MHSAILLLLVAVAIISATDLGHDSDEAITIFPLLSVQRKGGNPTAILASVMSFERSENPMTDEVRKLFLTSGGLTSAQATRMLTEVLPAMAAEGKSTHEQLLALLFVANQVSEDAIPYMTMSSERGCLVENIMHTTPISSDDECVCNEQDNVFFWISLLNNLKKESQTGSINHTSTNADIPDQMPILMMMALTTTPCDGKFRSSGTSCKCKVVTEGNEGLLMQMVASEPDTKDVIDPLAKEKLKEFSREPRARSQSLEQMLLAQSNSNINPSLIPILTNNGASLTDKLMQIILAGRGLDSTTTQLILNGGFGSDQNKVSMINYLANKGLVAADAVPFILGVDKGSNFFIQSMIHSGAIDPVVGLLLLSKQTGSSQSDVFQLITQILIGKTVNLDGIVKPYIPDLPRGIFPGSKLYFIHFETLGINTCSLHDLRNRFECGFTGITAAQCEMRPYCCYNPIFLTDDQVSNMTGGQIKTANAVPWCYYNVFFIYYDSFALTVKRAGGFASPPSCLPLFKYGLNLDPTVYYTYAQKSSLLGNMVNLRTECGFPGITEFHCVAIRGCCWDKSAPFNIPQCFYANGVTSFNYDLNSIPVAYLPRNHTCDTNYYQSPSLYYRRGGCSVTMDAHMKQGMHPLKIPDADECIYSLGCCYDIDDEVEKNYPQLARCYTREDGTYTVQPSNVAQLSELITRSGLAMDQYPPNSRPGN